MEIYLGADAVRRLGDLLAEQLGKAFGHRGQGELVLRPVLGPPEVGREKHLPTFTDPPPITTAAARGKIQRQIKDLVSVDRSMDPYKYPIDLMGHMDPMVDPNGGSDGSNGSLDRSVI